MDGDVHGSSKSTNEAGVATPAFSNSNVEDIQPFLRLSDKLQEDDGDDIDERSPRLRHRQATSSSAKKK